MANRGDYFMPKFQVTQKSPYPIDFVFEKIHDFMNEKEELGKFDSGAVWTPDPERKGGLLKGKQFSARVTIHPEESGSLVTFHMEIGLLLTPLKNKIIEILQLKLKKYLA
jgi:hypothetical protein